MICVYDPLATSFNGSGVAALMPLSGTIRQVAGGEYSFEMIHPMDPWGKWKNLKREAIVRLPVPRETIDSAFTGVDADLYEVTVETGELREGPSEPTDVSYPQWDGYTNYSVGSKVSDNGSNYRCTYFDASSGERMVPPGNSAWWTQISGTTGGSPVLATLTQGTLLYLVEAAADRWIKLCTESGVIGYIKVTSVQFVRHISPGEVPPRVVTEQLFRIKTVSVDRKNHQVSVSGVHVSNDLKGILVKNVTVNQVSPAMAISKVTSGLRMKYRGTIASNLYGENLGTYSGSFNGKNGLFCLLDPDTGIVPAFDAQFRRDNWDLFVMKKAERNTGYRITYGNNVNGINMVEKTDGLITRIMPVAKDAGGADLYLPEKWVDAPNRGQFPVTYMETLRVNGQVGKAKDDSGDGTVWTDTDLYAEMRARAGDRYSVDKVNNPVLEITVQLEQLENTVEYAALKDLLSVLLYDTVRVQDPEIDLDAQLVVSELEYDFVKEKISGVKLTNAITSIARTVTGYNVTNASIGSEKLKDGVADAIVQAAIDRMPEFADPNATRPAEVTVSDNNPTLSWGQQSTVGTVQGTALHVTMPARPSASVPLAADGTRGGIQIGYTQTGKNYPVQLSNEKAYVNVPWENTQREIVDNLTSTSTTAALSANQGRVLAGQVAGLGNVRTWHGECSTAAATAAKVVTISGLTEIKANDVFVITFTNAQTYNGVPTLNINSLGAHNIRRVTGTNAARYEWSAGETLTLVFNGTCFLIADGALATTTYYGMTKLLTSATSTSAGYALTPASLNSLVHGMVSDAPVYSANATYAVGDRARYGYQTWRCITAITTAETWTAAHWEALDPLQDQVDGKVDKISGKGLSTNDYTTAEKTKLAGIDMDTKVDKVSGKGLSTNDYTTAEKNKLAGIDMSTKVDKVSGMGLSSNDYTTAEKNKLAGIDMDSKVDKVTGKGLSTNDYTTAEKNKLAGIDMSTKVDKETGKGLSSNDYTTAEKTKLAGIDMDTKVDKETGKGLSSNDFTTAEKTKLASALTDADVVDNLTSSDADAPLSANQGRVLAGMIQTGGVAVVDDLTSTDPTSALSANQGRVLNEAKVDKVAGKGLSSEDYTSAEKTKLAGIDMDTKVDKVAGMGLSSNDYTTAEKNKLAGIDMSTKVDKETGKGLSTNDYTTAEKTKLASALTNADVVDNLTSTSATAALSANQGRVLNELVTSVSSGSNGYVSFSKIGKLCVVQIYAIGATVTPNKWATLGTLPAGYRPSRAVDFVCCDNSVGAGTAQFTAIASRVSSNGDVSVWVYRTGTQPLGFVAFLVD